jgi:15-cis-phytoene synthase
MGNEKEELLASQAYARGAAKRHAKSFYFASYPLPKEKKDAAYALYAFCRHADDLVDEAEDIGRARAALGRLQRDLPRVMAGEGGEPYLAAFADAVQRFGLEEEHLAELLEGVGRDLEPVVIPDWSALRDYCYHVASVVGLLMCPILGVYGDEERGRAIDLGIAMQLTNIIRDVGEDWRKGRVYIPQDELAEAGVRVDELGALTVGPRLRALLQGQIGRARDYYGRSEAGIRMLPQDGSRLTVWLMREIYADILVQVERNKYEVLRQRAHTSIMRKLRLAVRAMSKSGGVGSSRD